MIENIKGIEILNKSEIMECNIFLVLSLVCIGISISVYLMKKSKLKEMIITLLITIIVEIITCLLPIHHTGKFYYDIKINDKRCFYDVYDNYYIISKNDNEILIKTK